MGNYSWKRFWCLDNENLQLDYGGFLLNPENKEKSYYYYNPNLVSLDDISHIPCLILLGEAGMGKTNTMEVQYSASKLQIEQSGDYSLSFNLGDYSDETRLENKIFNDEKVINWKNKNNKLYLFLDSFDEGLSSLTTITRIIKNNVNKLPCDRLYLRITCRSADWKNSLTKTFEEEWGEDNVKTYNLCPLRRKDVEKALKDETIDDREKFFQELFSKEITLFATQPITLKFLIGIYQKDRLFPNSKTDLYDKGCLELCKEKNESRIEDGLKSEFSDRQRLIVAGRIATVVIFANKVAIWTHHDFTDKPNSDITIDELRIGQETIDRQQFNVTRECIEEVLSISGLFTSKGTNRLGFAHKTYAEFLAAWYLCEHKIPLCQIMNLIVAPADADGKLIPQLHQTCAWLSSLREDVLERIIETDADVVLKGDISDDDELKRKIVEKLLKLYDEEKLFDKYFTNSDYYHKLKHPQLAKQLQPYIVDKHKTLNVRREAVNIARCCQIIELQNDLVQLTLDNSEHIDLRVKSCACISVIGDRQARTKLKPLIFEELPEDTRDYLRYYALKALWNKEHPDLTAEELFSVLTPPKQNYIIGSYHIFISYEFVENLKAQDLIFALNWVKKQGVRNYLEQSIQIRDLADRILLKAWDHFDDPEIIKPFAEIALIQWNNYQGLITQDFEDIERFKQELEENHDKRRILIEKFVSIVPESINDIGYVFGYFYNNGRTYNISLEKDVFWLIEKIKETKDESIQKLYIDLTEKNFNRQNWKQIDDLCSLYDLYKKSNANTIFTNKFSTYFEAIDLDSEQAETLQSYHYKYRIPEEQPIDIEISTPSRQEKIINCLEKIESGELDYWYDLCREMMLSTENANDDESFELNLMRLLGWQNADDSIRGRIIECAKKYVLEKQDLDRDWIGTNTVDSLTISGCKALYLLLNVEPKNFVNQLDSLIWKKWASIIIAYPSDSDTNRDESYLELVYLTYSNAKTESIDTLLKLIDLENRERKYSHTIYKFKKCWDDRLKSAILNKIKQSKSILKPTSLEQLCKELIQHDCLEIIEFIKSLIKSFYSPTNQIGKDKIIIATRLLINHDILSQNLDSESSESWELIWQIIQEDTLFGREIVENLHYDSAGGFDLNLTETQLANFYIWLVQQYPYNKDPVYKGVHFVTVKDEVIALRNHLLNQLRETKTTQGCQEIERIIKTFRELDWLKQYLYDARRNVRLNSWQPHTPEEIFQLISDSNKRLVKDGNQLLEILIEALTELEKKLQNQPQPAAIDLWNELKANHVKGLSNSLIEKLKKKPKNSSQPQLQQDEKIEIWEKIDWKKTQGYSFYMPKDEERMSDYIKNYLEDYLKGKGIILNREAQTSRENETDIKVNAVKKLNGKEEYDDITVIIEVKGCWNPELDRAMETQLVDRYLKNNNTCKHGIYLIGWFDCSQWDDNDSRKKKTKKMTLEQAKAKYEEQAKELSISGINVRAFVLNTALR